MWALAARLAFRRTLVARYRIELFVTHRAMVGWKRLALERGLELERLRNVRA